MAGFQAFQCHGNILNQVRTIAYYSPPSQRRQAISLRLSSSITNKIGVGRFQFCLQVKCFSSAGPRECFWAGWPEGSPPGLEVGVQSTSGKMPHQVFWGEIARLLLWTLASGHGAMSIA